MTERPTLHPRHKHHWTDARPELFTNALVTCTICGLQMPRTVAKIDADSTTYIPKDRP